MQSCIKLGLRVLDLSYVQIQTDGQTCKARPLRQGILAEHVTTDLTTDNLLTFDAFSSNGLIEPELF